jgi:hypothetical protein
LDDDFSKIVGMSGPRKEANIADCTITTMGSAETILLDVGHALHDEANRPKDNPSNITTCPKSWLIELRDIGRVQQRYRQ